MIKSHAHHALFKKYLERHTLVHRVGEPLTKQICWSEGLSINERVLCRFREGAVRLSKGSSARQRDLPSDKEGPQSVIGPIVGQTGPYVYQRGRVGQMNPPSAKRYFIGQGHPSFYRSLSSA